MNPRPIRIYGKLPPEKEEELRRTRERLLREEKAELSARAREVRTKTDAADKVERSF